MIFWICCKNNFSKDKLRMLLQAMLEEQAEEQRARELEKQLAMMELDPNRTIMSVLGNELILY